MPPREAALRLKPNLSRSHEHVSPAPHCPSPHEWVPLTSEVTSRLGTGGWPVPAHSLRCGLFPDSAGMTFRLTLRTQTA